MNHARSSALPWRQLPLQPVHGVPATLPHLVGKADGAASQGTPYLCNSNTGNLVAMKNQGAADAQAQECPSRTTWFRSCVDGWSAACLAGLAALGRQLKATARWLHGMRLIHDRDGTAACSAWHALVSWPQQHCCGSWKRGGADILAGKGGRGDMRSGAWGWLPATAHMRLPPAVQPRHVGRRRAGAIAETGVVGTDVGNERHPYMALKGRPLPQGGQLGWGLAPPPPPVAARRRHPPSSPPLVSAALLAPGHQTCTCTL